MGQVVLGYGEYIGRLGVHMRKKRRGRKEEVCDLSYVTVTPGAGVQAQFVRFPHRLANGVSSPDCHGHQVRVSCYVSKLYANGLGGDGRDETVVCLQPEEHILAALGRIGS